MALQNPFSGAAALQTMSQMAQYNPLANAGQRLGDIAQLNARDELAGLMQNNGGKADYSMSPTAMLATPEAQKMFTGQQSLMQGDRRNDLTERGQDLTNSLGWAKHGLEKKKFSHTKKDQYMLDMYRASQIKGQYDKGLAAIRHQNFGEKGSPEELEYIKNNQYVLDGIQNKMSNYGGGGGTGGTPSVGGASGSPVTSEHVTTATQGGGSYTGPADAPVNAALSPDEVAANNNQGQMPGQHVYYGDDFDSTTNNIPGFNKGGRDISTDLRERWHGNSLTPKQREHLEKQKAKYGLNSFNDVWAQGDIDDASMRLFAEQNPDGSRRWTVDEIKEMTSHMVQPNSGDVIDRSRANPTIDDLTNVPSKKWNEDKNQWESTGTTTNYDYPQAMENTTFDPWLNPDGTPERGHYKRILGEMKVNGVPLGKAAEALTGAEYKPNAAKHRALEKKSLYAFNSSDGKPLQKQLTANVLRDSTSPKRIVNHLPTKADEAALEDNKFRESVYQQALSEVVNAGALGIDEGWTMKKLSRLIKAMPKDSTEAKNLKGIQGNIGLALNGSGAIRTSFDKEMAEGNGGEAPSAMDWLSEKSQVGILSDVADAFTKGGDGINFPGDTFKTDARDLTDQKWYSAAAAAWHEVYNSDFTYTKLANEAHNDRAAFQGGMSDVQFKEGSRAAQWFEKTKKAYNMRSENEDYMNDKSKSEAVSNLENKRTAIVNGKANLLPDEIPAALVEIDKELEFAKAVVKKQKAMQKRHNEGRKTKRIEKNKEAWNITHQNPLNDALTGKGGLFDLLDLDEQGNRRSPLKLEL